MATEPKQPDQKRRALLRGAAVTAAAGGVAAAAASCKYGSQLFLLRDAPAAKQENPAWAESRVRSYRKLGKTGFDMSDISFGCGGLNHPDVAKRGLERGITYFDTSPDYSDAASERALGEGIRGVKRDSLFLVSKFCSPAGHLADDTPVAEVIQAVEGSLTRLKVDYLDLVHIHAVNSIDRLMAPNIHEAFDRLKQAGKVRYLGVSSHTPDLEEVMSHAVDSGRFDVIMVAYNFKNWPGLEEIFARAHNRGVGVVAMKTLKGAYHSQLSEFTPTERESFAQAAFKWVLSNPHVSGLVVTMSNLQHIDEYLHASGQPLTTADLAILEKYDQLVAGLYCRPGCGDCLDRCPNDVPVNDILRYSMYAERYGREKDAMQKYARIDPAKRADQCIDCAAPCQAACDDGVAIKEQLVRADRLLRWA